MFTGRRWGLTVGHLPPSDGDRPLRRLDEAGDHAQQGGLSAARGTEEGDELAGGDLELDAAQHLVATERVAHPSNGQAAIAYLLAHSCTPIVLGAPIIACGTQGGDRGDDPEQHRDRQQQGRGDVDPGIHGATKATEDVDGQCLVVADDEEGDQELVEGEHERQCRRAREHRRDLRQRNPLEHRPRPRPEVARHVLDRAIESIEGDPHEDEDEREREHDVSDEHGQQRALELDPSQEGEQGGADEQAGKQHRRDEQDLQRPAHSGAGAGDRVGRGRSDQHGDGRGHDAEDEAVDECVGEGLVAEDLVVPAGREALERKR